MINEFSALVDRNIFPIPIKDLLEKETDYYLVYAPLSDNAFVADPDYVHAMNDSLKGCPVDDEINETMRQLNDCIPLSQRGGNIHSLDDFQNLSVLPNNKCNFSCKYCYSARGRSKNELSFEHFQAVLDRFIREDSYPRLTLCIYGGGEPLLSWEVVSEGILYARSRAATYNKELLINITTNGSIINEKILTFLKQNKVTLVVTFEILEEIQNMQRGSCKLVTSNIKNLIDYGIVPSLNSVITPKNVERMEEMVYNVIENYPQVTYLCFDPIIDKDTFKTVTELKDYHQRYIRNFFHARELAAENNIKVDCTAQISMDCTLERYCPGELGLTAQGLLSICPCISSPEEDMFDDYIYGLVNDQLKVEIDQKKLDGLLSRNLYSAERCNNCFAKYNCGGGCMHKNNILPDDYKDEVCSFTREFARRFLLARVDKQQFEESGKHIVELI